MQKGKLEEHLGRLKGIDKEVLAFRASFDELERYNHDIQEAMIFDNRHTPYTMEVCIYLRLHRLPTPWRYTFIYVSIYFVYH